MKKLNKKGFTLVELLAVVVILAILIVVVATTALPAMNNAKQKALNTYGQRVCEKAKELCMSAYLLDSSATCSYDSIDDIMGEDNDEYKISTSIAITPSNDGATITAGAVQDENGALDVYECE